MNKLLMVALLAVSGISLQLSACKSGGCSTGCAPSQPAPKCAYQKTCYAPAQKHVQCETYYTCPDGTGPASEDDQQRMQSQGMQEGGKY
jgi:hypothetical protein